MSEDPTESAQEDIHHHATHGEHGGNASRWITAAALTAALLAALAAIAGGKSGSHLTEATHNRIQCADTWSEFQAKSIKKYVLTSEVEVLKALKADAPPGADAKLAEDKTEGEQLMAKANRLNVLSEAHLQTHETFEHATMMFHISIAIVAIAVVARRREFWYVSILGGIVGLYLFGKAYLHAPAAEPPEPAEAPASQHAPAEPHG